MAEERERVASFGRRRDGSELHLTARQPYRDDVARAVDRQRRGHTVDGLRVRHSRTAAAAATTSSSAPL